MKSRQFRKVFSSRILAHYRKWQHFTETPTNPAHISKSWGRDPRNDAYIMPMQNPSTTISSAHGITSTMKGYEVI